MAEADFKRACEATIREYFDHGVLAEAEDGIRELLDRFGGAPVDRSSDDTAVAPGQAGGGLLHPGGTSSTTIRSTGHSSRARPGGSMEVDVDRLRAIVAKRAVTASLDRGAREREMAARLLATLNAHGVVARARMEEGFDLILQDVDALAIDVPNAPDELGIFLARAVVDGVVSREYLKECVEAPGLDRTPHGVALSARGALAAAGGEASIRMAWGGPDGATAEAVRREMDALLREYGTSRDAREAFRRLAELSVPYYHHEFVRAALTTAMEEARLRPQQPRRVMDLLGYLSDAGLVNGTQCAKGFARVATALKEMTLDIPDAQEQFEALVTDAKGRGLLPAGLSAWASYRGSLVPGSNPGGGGDGRGGRAGRGGLRGHMMRLDSAPDLVKLAETVSRGGGRAGHQAAAARGANIKPGSHVDFPSLRRAAGGPAGGKAAAPSRLSGVKDGAQTHAPTPTSSGVSAGVDAKTPTAGASSPGRLKMSYAAAAGGRVHSGWSGLRAPRANARASRLGGGDADAGSGSDAERARANKPKRPLPSILGSNLGGDGGGSAKAPGLTFLAAHTHRPTLGVCAWRAVHDPAPARVSGEGARAGGHGRVSDERLRVLRGFRRTRSAPAGLEELDNDAHILSIGAVHRHRPFAAEYDVDMGEAVGTGGFAVVRRCTHRATGATYAVKSLRVNAKEKNDDDDDDDDSGSASSRATGGDDESDEDSDDEGGPRKLEAMTMEEVTNELVMMQQLSGHPNIVTIREFFTEGGAASAPRAKVDGVERDAAAVEETDDGVVHVVMELLRGQELVDAITAVGMYAERDARTVMSNMLDAIAFMHARGVVHRDLKLENLVLARPNDLDSVTLVDFGLAKALMARERAENVCGTLAYVAPEALLAGTYGQGVDVWALGVAMHVLLTGLWPFDNDDDDELMDEIIECDLDFDAGDAWRRVSPEAKDLLRGLLEPDPKRRLHAAQALEHAWFTGQRANTSERLHHVHARLDALVGSSRQHPERRFRPGARLATQGQASDEVFVITAGECEVFATPAEAANGEGDGDKDENGAGERFVCEACEEDYDRWHDQCPGCKVWESLKPSPIESVTAEATAETATAKDDAERARTETVREEPAREKPRTSASSTRIGRRRKGNLVGEIPLAPRLSDADRAPSSASSESAQETPRPSALTVVATTEVRALVFDRADVEWASGHDYRLSEEFERALRERRRVLAKQARLAARAEREARERGDEGGSGALQRATSDVVRRG